MKSLIVAILTILVIISCVHHSMAQKPEKRGEKPQHIGIDYELQPFVDDFTDRAKARNIVFTHKLTAGFKKINRGNVIGLCVLDEKFREVDIDSPFWEDATIAEKMALVFHELGHCLCTRGHDYGKGKDYPSNIVSQILDDLAFRIPFRAEVKPGYYPDGCALSIMAPSIQNNDCIVDHHEDYFKEMLDRCEPY